MRKILKPISKSGYLSSIILLLFVAIFLAFGYMVTQKNTSANPRSAWDYFLLERDFLNQYAEIPDYGGYAYWVGKLGEMEDPRLFSIYQANFILWVGGIESQHPSEVNRTMIQKSADALLENLYKGEGEWFEWIDQEVNVVQEFNWNPRSEAHIAYALLEAHRILDDERYLNAANQTLGAQRQKNPAPPITAEYTEGLDIGYRFPEHMGHLMQTVMSGSPEGKNYADAIDEYYRGDFGKEPHPFIEDAYSFLHGAAVVDKLLYAYLSKNEEAMIEARALYAGYTRQGHDDYSIFENNVSEVSDNGRDYYDKRLSMALILWSETLDTRYRKDAIDMWYQSLRFWDKQDPYGFFVNLSQDRKTCFTINQPAMIMDLIPPEILSAKDHRKFWWNHQLRLLVRDPDYQWLDHNMKGIGVDPSSIRMHVPYGSRYGGVNVLPADCDDCFILEINYFSFKNGRATLKLADYFGNKVTATFDSKVGFSPRGLLGWNWWSWMYYLTSAFIFILLFSYLYIKTLGWKGESLKKYKKNLKIKKKTHEKN